MAQDVVGQVVAVADVARCVPLQDQWCLIDDGNQIARSWGDAWRGKRRNNESNSRFLLHSVSYCLWHTDQVCGGMMGPWLAEQSYKVHVSSPLGWFELCRSYFSVRLRKLAVDKVSLLRVSLTDIPGRLLTVLAGGVTSYQRWCWCWKLGFGRGVEHNQKVTEQLATWQRSLSTGFPSCWVSFVCVGSSLWSEVKLWLPGCYIDL